MTSLHLGEGTTANTREDRDNPFKGVVLSVPSVCVPCVPVLSLVCPFRVPFAPEARR